MTWPDEQPGAYRGRFHRPELIRFAHLDLSLTGDATGVVVGCVSGFDRVKRGENTETLPRVRVDFALQVHPPRGGEIPFEKILEFDPDTDLGSVFVAGTSTLP